MFTRSESAHVACNFNCRMETEGLLKVTGSLTYIAKVVICRKRCKITMLLLQTTNRKWHTAYQIAPFSMTLSDFKVIHVLCALCSSWQDFNWHSASRGPSAIADLLVTQCDGVTECLSIKRPCTVLVFLSVSLYNNILNPTFAQFSHHIYEAAVDEYFRCWLHLVH